jgi:chemotaxis methyl-accepting protein methylase
VRGTVFDTAGIVLEPGKEYLVESRLGSLTRRLSLASLDDLLVRLKRDEKDCAARSSRR